MRICVALLCLALMPRAHALQCSAESGPHTAALVELYTSEGCSSCPPADRWLRSLGSRGHAPGRVVPLALHVDYWDYIGWKDPYAQKRFSDRQRRLAKIMRSRVVYTPQVLLQGKDFRRWYAGAFDRTVQEINARAPGAKIALRLEGAGQTRVQAELLATGQAADVALYLAGFESRLVSRISAGENEGRTLEHDYVVRAWVGPIAFRDGRVDERHALAHRSGEQLGAAAFVQNRRTAEVLQALMLPPCPGQGG